MSENNGEQNNIVVEHTIYAEPIFHLGGFTITNAMLNSWLVVVLIVVFGFYFKNKIKKIPTGWQNFLEMILEMFLRLFDGVTGDRKKTLKFAPLVLAFFFFILLNNWLGVFPGVGSIGQVVKEGSELVFVPYFRGGTADLNTTLALATIGVVASHIFGVMAIGAWNHFNKFINIKAFLEIPKKIKKDPMILLINPIKAFIGIIETISEFAKIASLSLRLFGNVFAGEVLLASISALLAFGIPLPFMFLEIGVGLIQALIFSILSMAYISTSTVAEEH
jgi:F-type H+-transporting ATPase subunit a